jgi:hypothetical protein
VRNQSSGNHHQYPGHYNHKKLMRLMADSGHNARTLAKKTKLSKTTIGDAMVGECKKFETLWIINTSLDGNWPDLFYLD